MQVNILHAGFCTAPEHIAIQGGARRTIHFPAMFALFRHPAFGAMLFDTGYSPRFFDETRRFPKRFYRWMTPVTLHEEDLVPVQLARFGLSANDISHVFISHFHADHIAALPDLPRAHYVYLPSALDPLRGMSSFQQLKIAFMSGLLPADFDSRARPVDMARSVLLSEEYAPFQTGHDLLGDGSLIGVELPGHAHGQMGLFARDENGQVFFFVADAAWLKRSILENRPPHPVTNFLFPDPAAYRATLSNLQQYTLTHPSVHVIPSHCEETIRAFEDHAG